MNILCCYDDWGNAVEIASEKVSFRPAVYGILIEREQVLLQRHLRTDLWQPPGLILHSNQPPSLAIRQRFRRITGLSLVLGPLLFVEDQYRVDGPESAWHLSLLYYALERPQVGRVAPTVLPADDQPQMIPIDKIQREQMQFGFDAIQAGRLRLAL
jgi:ADP-ribose pyrophosphatase YjhB (NUDIX family)